ncbi:MAG TPA: hypothetical protein PLM41_22700, partial [Saprospiraceae bacterium]|nr:hypothetical protein [Saprospiraceae bacterium]
MRTIFFLLAIVVLCTQCQQNSPQPATASGKPMKDFIEQFYRDRLAFYPLEATQQGMEGYNDQLPITVSEDYRRQLRDFYTRTQTALAQFKPEQLDANDR